MRITEAAQRLGTSPRMLRYRDSLGLLPAVREQRPSRRSPRWRAGQAASVPPRPGPPPQAPAAAAALHRRFDQHDLDAVALALGIERRYDITPAALAFGLRVLAEPAVRADVAELGRRIGRIQAPTARALDFEQERALRLLSMTPRRLPRPDGCRSAPAVGLGPADDQHAGSIMRAEPNFVI
jgi:MerR family transcriptional regulator, copper efflux regulator